MERTLDHHTASTARARGLSAERFLRTHPASTAAMALAIMACIATAQVENRSDVSLALSYAIPLWLFAYATGPLAGALAATAVAGLWLFDAANLHLSARDMEYIFAVRVLTNLGLVVMAVFAARAAQARDGHLAAQEELLQFRRDLVAAFSHDLRTPLSAIVYSLQMLRERGADWRSVEAVDAVDRALANSHRLDSLVRDMMGVEQSGSPFALHVSTLQPFQLINDLQTEFGALNIRNDRIALLWETDPYTPPLHTDRGKLTSVLRNLISNALKFTSVGTIRIHIGYDNVSGMHRLEVADTGRGIPPETLPLIFKRFYRGPDTEAVGGFGFGLFIVSTFVDMLGGTVSVTSELGQGSSFVVHVPRLVADQTPAAIDQGFRRSA
jgi:signal transduction histidine kinase